MVPERLADQGRPGWPAARRRRAPPLRRRAIRGRVRRLPGLVAHGATGVAVVVGDHEAPTVREHVAEAQALVVTEVGRAGLVTPIGTGPRLRWDNGRSMAS